MLLTEPIVGFLSFYVAFNFAVLYSFFAAFSLDFRHSIQLQYRRFGASISRHRSGLFARYYYMLPL
jgi:hypothetical protein